MSVPRNLRLASLLRDEINGLLRKGVKDPRLASASITRIELAGDCRNGRALFTCLGDQSGAEEAARAFDKAAGFFRRQLGRKLRLRQVPDLRYEHDHVLHEATEVRLMIDRVVEEDRQRQRDRGEPDEVEDESLDELAEEE